MKPNVFKDDSRAGLYHLPAVYCGDLPDLASKTHHTLLSADVSASKNSQETLRELGKAWQFPLWYGTNLDALHDCLTDPDWQAKKKIILKITGLDTLKSSHPEAFSTLIEVLRSAAAIRSAANHPLWILLTSPTPDVANLPDA